ncbi:hypothetical protein DCCM_0547 [Desulfocucumis palustris]|uniref:Copper amine oxidase-like N-terminal domain-containing protein n=1 Tax=Desulfocucumis palustris TaxID=1898651 RepID=A0A2L2X9S0_9FIRM|nr:hypothetical protein [Desulfocucumis palustris]GBF32353.1 hypothetical protein DCCM_0547 [Desulfocucumis palustris]
MTRIKNTLMILLIITAMLSMYGTPVLAADKPQGKTGIPIKTLVSVDGNQMTLQAYTIGGSKYFKLRDIAMALSKTRKHFDVSFNETSNEINILANSTYSEMGCEPVPSEDMESRTASLSTSKIYLNSRPYESGCTTYNIDDNNCFRLPDLAEALDFYIAPGTANTIEIDTSAGYSVTGNKIYYSDDTPLAVNPKAGVKSSLTADLDGDGKNETIELVASEYATRKWTLVYKDGNSEASVSVFKGNEYGFGTSITAGHIISEDSVDFLITSYLMSMPFGGNAYELYSFQNEAFTRIDVTGITDGTEFDVSVDESNKTAKLMANGSEKTVRLCDMALSDYKLYEKEFCQDFFIEMKLQSVLGCALPELATTEVIAAVLPNDLTYLHTTYRYVDGVWKVQSVEFYDFGEATTPYQLSKN